MVFFLEIGLMKLFSSFSRPHSRICIGIYFLFQAKKKHTHKQKAKEANNNNNDTTTTNNNNNNNENNKRN